MLEPRHFIKDESKGEFKWEKLVGDGTVVKCKTCGKWIWPMWHADCYPKLDAKTALLPPMEECAVCYFRNQD